MDEIKKYIYYNVLIINKITKVYCSKRIVCYVK